MKDLRMQVARQGFPLEQFLIYRTVFIFEFTLQKSPHMGGLVEQED